MRGVAREWHAGHCVSGQLLRCANRGYTLPIASELAGATIGACNSWREPALTQVPESARRALGRMTVWRAGGTVLKIARDRRRVAALGAVSVHSAAVGLVAATACCASTSRGALTFSPSTQPAR